MDLRKLGVNTGKIVLGGTLLFFIYLLLLISAQYIPPRDDVAFLVLKEDELHILYYRLAFFTHVYASWFVIFCGFFQFWKIVRQRWKKAHNYFGYIYIVLILGFAGPSGLIMALHANGGWAAKISFTILSLLWFYFTFQAYDAIRHRDVHRHQKYMIRSYALTLSAISLRFFKLILAQTLHLPPMDMYQLVAWSSWMFNLLAAEFYIYRSFPSPRTTS